MGLLTCQIKSCLGVMLLSMLEGMAIGWASPALAKFAAGTALFAPTGEEKSLIVSLFDIGVMLGSWSSTVVFTLTGRRQTVLVGPVTLTAWVLLTALGNSAALLIVARLLAGCGMGIALSFSYIYVGEVTTKQHRGPLILTTSLLMPTGQLVAFLLGSNVPWVWQSVYPAPVIALMLICVIFFMQETPIYLAGKERYEEMERSLRALRQGVPDAEILAEMEAIKASVKRQKEDATTWREMFKPPGAKKAAGLVLVESSALALLGVTNVLAYTQQIFEAAGGGELMDITWFSVVFILVEIAAIGCAVYLIERVGRRVQLSSTAIGACLASVSLSVYFYFLKENNNSLPQFTWVPMLTMLVFIACIGGGLHTIPPVLMSELLDQRAKAVIAPACMTIMSLTSFGINQAFLPMETQPGFWAPFAFFACTNAAIALFTLLLVPETKGKTLAEVQSMLRGDRVKKEIL